MVLSFKSAASEVLRVTKQVKEDKAIWVCNFHSSYTCFWNYSLFYLFIYLNCRFHFHKTHILVGLKVNCENNIICRDCILHFRVWEKPLHLGGLESFILRHKLLFFFNFFWAIIKKNLGWLIDVCFYTFLVKIITLDLQRVPLKIVNAPKGRQKWELQSECYQTYVKGRCLPCSTLRLFLSCRSQRNYVRMRIYALPFNMQMIFTLQSILQQIIIIF